VPNEAFPRLLSDLEGELARGQPYSPRHPLWTNGLEKDRRLVLPVGATVDASNRSAWVFPPGTRFFKTFSVTSSQSGNGVRPVETRVMFRGNQGWEFGVYLWRADGSDAELHGGGLPVAVPLVDAEGRSFTHQVPSLPQCNLCHLTNLTTVIGFSELQLNVQSPVVGGTNQLEAFFQAGLLSGALPGDPDAVEGADQLTRDIVGYAQGNCSFCHNEKTLAGGLNLSHPVFLANTLNRPSVTGGILIQPGDPDGSVYYQRFSGGTMPALGVQLGDSVTYGELRDWIEDYPPGG